MHTIIVHFLDELERKVARCGDRKQNVKSTCLVTQEK